jgi:hypothetical protein
MHIVYCTVLWVLYCTSQFQCRMGTQHDVLSTDCYCTVGCAQSVGFRRENNIVKWRVQLRLGCVVCMANMNCAAQSARAVLATAYPCKVQFSGNGVRNSCYAAQTPAAKCYHTKQITVLYCKTRELRCYNSVLCYWQRGCEVAKTEKSECDASELNRRNSQEGRYRALHDTTQHGAKSAWRSQWRSAKHF